MSSKFTVFFIVLVTLLFGCYGERVDVPTGHVGKVVSPEGIQKGIKTTSSFRLPYTPFWAGQYYLVLVESSDHAIREPLQVFMPKDQLVLSFDIRATLSIPSDDEPKIESIFSRLSPTPRGDNTKVISFDVVYATYAQPIIREIARSVIAQYTIEQIMSSRNQVSEEIEKVLREKLANSPLLVLNAGLADVQPPDVIVKAQSLAKEREIAIQRAEAEKLVSLTEAGANLEVAKKQQEIDLVEAETQARVNQILASGITEAFVIQRSLRILEAMAASNNKVFIVPESVFSNPALLVGISNEALTKETKNVE